MYNWLCVQTCQVSDRTHARAPRRGGAERPRGDGVHVAHRARGTWCGMYDVGVDGARGRLAPPKLEDVRKVIAAPRGKESRKQRPGGGMRLYIDIDLEDVSTAQGATNQWAS